MTLIRAVAEYKLSLKLLKTFRKSIARGYLACNEEQNPDKRDSYILTDKAKKRFLNSA